MGEENVDDRDAGEGPGGRGDEKDMDGIGEKVADGIGESVDDCGPAGATDGGGRGCAVGADGTSPLHPLARLSVLVHAEVVATADRNGLTPMQARMLGLLTDRPRRMSSLAQDLGVEKAALTGLVDRAQTRGLVRREAVPGDRRATRIAVTEAGARAAERFYAQLTAALDDLLAVLPAQDRAAYDRSTRALLAGAPTGSPTC